ncbi:MAG TPA: hypothetical protein PKY30_24220 [Myxococcota bacterium]|nr:hypothetical protein [Myxococcota bacterium]
MLLLSTFAFAQTAAPDARFALALFCNPTCDDHVLAMLDEELGSIRGRSGFPEVVTQPGRIMGIADDSFPIPNADFLEVYGVEVDRPEALVKSQQVVLAWFAAPADQAVQTLTTAQRAFAKAAKESGGWVEDLDTQQIFGVEAFARRDPAGKLEDWFVVDAAPQDEAQPDGAVRLVTRGLRRFGLPELVVEDVDPGMAADVGVVLNAAAANLRKQKSGSMSIQTDTVSGTATFVDGKRRDDDPDDPLWKMSFDGQITIPGEEVDPEDLAAAPPEVAAPPSAPAVSPAPAAAPVPVAEAGPAPTVDRSPPPPVGKPRNLDEAKSMVQARFQSVVRAAWEQGLPPGEVVAVSAPFRSRSGGTPTTTARPR